MTWALIHTSGRELARGSYATVTAAAEERGLLRILTCGRDTGDPAWMPQWTSRDFVIVPLVERPAMRRAA